MTSSPPPHPYAAEAEAEPEGRPTSSKRRAWFIAAVVALAFTVLVAAFVVVRAQVDAQRARAEASRAADELGLEYPDVVWPRNMVSGGILFEGGDGALVPRESEALEDNELPQPYEADRDDETSDIVLYVDYRCPVCSQFEHVNGETLKEAVQGGGATLEVRPLTFLDRVDETDYYSSRASSAMACIADSRPELAWAAHRALLSPDFMPTETTRGYTNEELVETLDAVDGGLDGATRSCIENESFVPFAAAMNQWSFAYPVPDAVDDGLSVEGTPFAVLNGIPYEGAPADAAEFREFLEQQGVRLS